MPDNSSTYYGISNQVLPETVVSKTTQPAMSFVRVIIGGSIEVTTLPPDCVRSFEISRIEGGGEEFTLALFDDNWEELESILSSYAGYVDISYGYVGGSTKTFRGQLTDYSIEFTSTGATIMANGVSESAMQNLTNMVYDTETLNPTEAAMKICREQGWSVSEENFAPSLDIPASNRDSFALLGEHPIQYIVTKLAPLAVRSSDGASGYRFYLDETQNPPVAYFRPVMLNSAGVRTYIYMKGVDSSVRDLQMSVNGVFGATGTSLVTTNLNSSFIDPETKEMISIDKDLNSPRVYATGEYTHTRTGVSEESIDAAGNNAAQMNAILNYRLSAGSYPYEGILQIVGDPDIKYEDTIRLIIITDSGHLHHTSGIYKIKSIIDSISDGFYLTTLDIWKDANIETGLEILNPRVLIK